MNKTNPQLKLMCHLINTVSKHNVQKSPVRFVILYKMLVWCKHCEVWGFSDVSSKGPGQRVRIEIQY